MRKCDWTDYRQALEENNFNTAVAVQTLQERGFSLNDIVEAGKELEMRAKNPLIKKAMTAEKSHTFGIIIFSIFKNFLTLLLTN